MIFRSYPPGMQLEPFIEVIHLRHFVFPSGSPLPFKPYPPRAEHCLALYVRGAETTESIPGGERFTRPRSVLSGQFTHQINRYVTHEFLLILVVFRPGALNRLTGIPFRELANQAVDAEAVWGRPMQELNDRLGSAGGYEEMIALVYDYLQQLVRSPTTRLLPADQAMQWLLRQHRPLTVAAFAGLSCLSTRQLERHCLDRIGVPPKTFLRILRFTRSYFLQLKQPRLDGGRIALQCGYADYQQMAKDYRAFTGTTPHRLFQEEQHAPERVLGLRR